MTPLQWRESDDTGLSSITIWAIAQGIQPRFPSEPSDPADFGRCYRLLQHFPHWRLYLSSIAAIYPAWRGLVEHWEELTALYEEESPSGKCPKLYERMCELRRIEAQ